MEEGFSLRDFLFHFFLHMIINISALDTIAKLESLSAYCSDGEVHYDSCKIVILYFHLPITALQDCLCKSVLLLFEKTASVLGLRVGCL